MFRKKIKSPIGLDISDLSLKTVQLNKANDKIKIQALSKIELPEGIIENGEIKNKELAIKYIRDLISKPKIGSINSNEVVCSLPDSKTFIKLITIEQTINKLNDIIESEIEKHIPLSLNDIYYDWQVIKQVGDVIYVLIGAAPKSIVNQYINILNASKLVPIAMEIESGAICRCLLAEESPKNKKITGNNYAIVDIGAKRSGVTVYADKSLILSVSIPISSTEITNKISESLEITKEQAEKAKIICGLDETKAQGIIKEILADMIKTLSSRIQSAIEYYNNNHSEYGPISRILLCGGGSYIKNLPEILTNDLQIPVNWSDPLINTNEDKNKIIEILTGTHEIENVSSDGEISSVRQDTSQSYATAIGLALRKLFINI